MEPSTAIIIKVIILFLFLLFVFYKEKGITIYIPIILLGIVYFCEFGISSLLMVFDPGNFWLLDYFSLNSVDTGMTFIVLVFLMFILGYYAPQYDRNLQSLFAKLLEKLPNVNNYTLEIKNLNFVIVILLILGWISRIIIFQSGLYFHATVGFRPTIQIEGLRNYSQYFAIAITLPIFAMALAFIEWIKNKRRKYLILSLVLLLSEIAFALPTGSKEKVVFPLLILTIIFSLKQKVSLVPVSLLFLFFSFFVFPFIGIYRSIYLTGDIFANLQAVVPIYFEIYTNLEPKVFAGILNTIFSDRLNYSVIVSNIIIKTPLVWDYLYGNSYVQIFISLIPRVIWPGKPTISDSGNRLGREYGFISPIDFSTSIDMTWVGEMFLNFGWFGILIGFLYGVFYRFIYVYFLRDKKLSYLGVIMYPIALYYMIRGGAFVIQFSGLLKIYFTLLVFFYPFLRRIKDDK